MASASKNKLNIETTSKHTNTPVNNVLKEIQEKCYENLMDVCRSLAASLNVNTNAVMTIQVSNYELMYQNIKIRNISFSIQLTYYIQVEGGFGCFFGFTVQKYKSCYKTFISISILI